MQRYTVGLIKEIKTVSQIKHLSYLTCTFVIWAQQLTIITLKAKAYGLFLCQAFKLFLWRPPKASRVLFFTWISFSQHRLHALYTANKSCNFFQAIKCRARIQWNNNLTSLYLHVPGLYCRVVFHSNILVDYFSCSQYGMCWSVCVLTFDPHPSTYRCFCFKVVMFNQRQKLSFVI